MKRKLNLILIPITIAVLGILYFQVDWMIKTYKAENTRLENGSGTALSFALEKHRNEQRAADSTYIVRNLKKWVDTVKMNYINMGDSLHIDLEYAHPEIPHPTMKTGYYMHVSLSSPDNVSIMSPGILSIGKITPATIAADQKNIRLDDSLSKFFHRNKVSDGRVIYEQAGERDTGQFFKSDSAKILRYFRAFLIKNKVTDPGKNPPTIFFAKFANYVPRYWVSYVGFQQNVFHKYPDKNLIGYYYANKTSWLITHIALRVTIALLLVVILVFSFGYLIKIIKQQKQLADIKDDFIDNLTHEFKTPIATISAAIEGMQKFNALENKEKTERYLDISKGELTRLNDMVTKLLNISVYEKNNLTLSLHQVDLVQLVSDIISMEKFRATKPIKFTVDIAEEVRLIHADPLHFKNVLINLVDNAVKYSNDSVDITFTGFEQRSQLIIKVRDNGIGIPANQLKNVFDKFYRVPTGDLHNVKGSGLGLSYVRSVIEAHGGTITVNSEINVQTEFIISIPLK